jgi:biopolymer transport protein ExbD
MSDDLQKSREEVIQEWLDKHQQEVKKERSKRRVNLDTGGVTITSLMDGMTIILVFLLMNYSVDPIRVDASDDLRLPPSNTEITPQASASITVSAVGIVVNDKVVVPVKDGVVDKAFKGGDENALQIQPLFEALNEAAQTQKEISQRIGSKFEGLLTVIAHQETTYRLITEVLYTAGQAEFQKFKFTVLKGAQRG